MKTHVREIYGNWDAGYALDKHVLSSRYIGGNEYGRPQFDTTRSEVGEALFQLKYRGDMAQVDKIATALAEEIYPKFADVGFIVPMPASTPRLVQPVTEIARNLSKLIDKPLVEGLLTKVPGGGALKDMHDKGAKVEALKGHFLIDDVIQNAGCWNALLVDDLFDTGASLEVATAALRTYPKVGKIFVATATWKR